VRVSDQTRSQSLDFNPDALPLVSIPIFVESPDSLHPLQVQIQVLDSWGRLAHQFVSFTGRPIGVAGVRSEPYQIIVVDPEDWQKRLSEPVRVTATSDMKMTRIALTSRP
jgi:hypothetical protein